MHSGNSTTNMLWQCRGNVMKTRWQRHDMPHVMAMPWHSVMAVSWRPHDILLSQFNSSVMTAVSLHCHHITSQCHESAMAMPWQAMVIYPLVVTPSAWPLAYRDLFRCFVSCSALGGLSTAVNHEASTCTVVEMQPCSRSDTSHTI